MSLDLPEFQSLRTLTSDGRFLFTTRIARLFAYGFLSVILVLYLAEVGLNEMQIGLLLTLTLMGDTAISLWITTTAENSLFLVKRKDQVLRCLLDGRTIETDVDVIHLMTLLSKINSK